MHDAVIGIRIVIYLLIQGKCGNNTFAISSKFSKWMFYDILLIVYRNCARKNSIKKITWINYEYATVCSGRLKFEQRLLVRYSCLRI